MSNSKNIVVFCGSSMPSNQKTCTAFNSIGETIGLNKHTLIYGGGQQGAMGLLAQSALEVEGKVIGIVPQCYAGNTPFDHKNYTHINAESMDNRKRQMNNMADMFILAPGGSGSLDEFFWAMSTHSMPDVDPAHHTAPIHVLNINGIYNGLYQQLCTLVAEGFISTKSFNTVTFHNSTEELLEVIVNLSEI